MSSRLWRKEELTVGVHFKFFLLFNNDEIVTDCLIEITCYNMSHSIEDTSSTLELED